MESLKDYARHYNIELTDKMISDFQAYLDLLLEWNETMNLTAITEPDEVVVKHFLDSLLALDAREIPPGASLIDVGTGAGFPAIPLKIVRPDLRVTLLDGTDKKLRFLRAVSERLGQENQTQHARAEEAARIPGYRECFDVITARAVASLPVLCEYCLPFAKPGGVFLALKGPDADRELAEARNAIKRLGGGAAEAKVKAYTLPDGGERRIIAIKKISATPSKYPRSPAQIKKSPL
jgi:16S rRNA (guanine(527)-N(7))-methyltransferase RsmG